MMKLYYTVLVDGGVGHAGQEVEVVGEPADAEDDDYHHQPAQDHDQPPRHPSPLHHPHRDSLPLLHEVLAVLAHGAVAPVTWTH